MRGLILTGPLGVGKTTAQQKLVHEHGFWSPFEVTTRTVGEKEASLKHMPEREFIECVKQGKLVFPVEFAGHWYAWDSRDLQKMMEQPCLCVVNVRPYTALILSAIFRNMFAVWLWASTDELERRRSQRNAKRDHETELSARRRVRDTEDAVYEPMFCSRIEADENLITNLLKVAEK